MGSNNDFVVYGTPLEPLEEDEIPKKRPAPDLTVRDEKGRQRFHGAFTGGFSAGYFNTVGTKEGWAPSSFTSSRKKKADGVQQQNPEDFMDEEDLGVFGIAPRRVQTTKDFQDDKVAKKRPFPLFTEGPIPGEAPLRNLIQPVSESIGMRLLKNMGWRVGQGIGPRVKKSSRAASLQNEEIVFGCALPPAQSEDADDIYAEGYTFAPKDIATLPYTPKENLFGIGYSGLAPDNVKKVDKQPSTMTVLDKGKKLSIRGQAFGVGAFEDDDEDIYSRDDMSQYNFALDEPELDRKQTKKIAASTSKLRHIEKALEGFHLAKQAPLANKQFDPPELPKHFRPFHRPPPGFHVADLEPPVEEHNRFLDRHSLTVVDRGIALEGGFKGSVFDLISESDRKRLTAIKHGQNVPNNTTEQPESSVREEPIKHMPNSHHKPKQPVFLGSSANRLPEKQAGDNKTEENADTDRTDFANHLSDVSKAFQLTSFKPFVKDKEKQERYEQFLVLAKDGDREKLEKLQPRTMTEWEKQKEMEEFYRAALLYRPLAASLGSRFTSARNQENDDNFVEVSVDQEVNEDDQQKAASLKMFGHLTRSSFEWHPDRLLCRRFNVPNPYPDSAMVGLPTVKRDKVSIFNFLTTEDELKSSGKLPAESSQSTVTQPETTRPEESQKMETEATENLEPELEGKSNEEVEEKPRPPMDLFRAIFQDTDSENDKSSESDGEQEHAAKAPDPQPPHPSRAGKGVFANLDLDALCRRPTGPIPAPSTSQGQRTEEPKIGAEAKKPPEPHRMLYGPALPPCTLPLVVSKASSNESSHKHKKHKKHKHKSKKSKNKSKHSNKYTSKDRTDSNNSSDSSVSNLDLIQKLVEVYRRKK